MVFVILLVGAVATTVALFLHRPFSVADQPFPDAHEYLNAAYRLAHGQGYTTTVRDYASSPHLRMAVNPPRFPPGTSLVLAPFALLGSYPANVEFGSQLITVALVLAVGWAAYTLAGRYAGLLAVILASTSEFVMKSMHLVMSDPLAALLAVLCVPLLSLRKPWAIYLLGLVAGYSVVVRVSGLVIVIAVLIVVSGWDRLRAATAAALPVVLLGIYNWTTFGEPWSTGYGYWLKDIRQYSVSYIFKHPWSNYGEEPYYFSELRHFHVDLVANTHAGVIGLLANVWFYPLIVIGVSAVFGPPLVTLVGLIAVVRRWRWRSSRFTLVLIVLTVLVFLPNLGQDPRYMAGTDMVLLAWAGAAAVFFWRWLFLRYEEPLSRYRWLPRPSTSNPERPLGTTP